MYVTNVRSFSDKYRCLAYLIKLYFLRMASTFMENVCQSLFLYESFIIINIHITKTDRSVPFRSKDKVATPRKRVIFQLLVILGVTFMFA